MTIGHNKSGSNGNVQHGSKTVPCSAAGAAKVTGGVSMGKDSPANKGTAAKKQKSGSKGS